MVGRNYWTVERFLREAKLVHGDKFNYDKVTKISTGQTLVPINCLQCGQDWFASPCNHIVKKSGCRNCYYNKQKWTLSDFLEKAKAKRGDSYDYSEIKEENVRSSESIVNVTCKNCHRRACVRILDHLNAKFCQNCRFWTMEKFLKAAKEIHGDLYDYTNVAFQTCRTLFVVKCKLGHEWETNITYHVINKHRCLHCFGSKKYTLEQFVEKGKLIHPNLFDYSEIKEDHMKGILSRVPITCRICNYRWSQRITNHVSGKGCPNCGKSKGETKCSTFLTNKNITFEKEKKFENLGKKRFDFYFEWKERNYLLEFDGKQHFKFNKHFHKTTETFLKNQEVDVEKSKFALENNLFLIRIDYKSFHDIEDHLECALNMSNDDTFYFSNIWKYDYILSTLDF